jgi:hypothetical protein
MKTILILCTALTLAALPALAQEVHIDYDRMARFTTYKTFGWSDSPETSLRETSDMMHERIKKTIIDTFAAGRLNYVTSDPDLLVTYHTSSREDFQVNTASFGYGYPGSWGWDPYWGGSFSTTTVTPYTRGTLIIDVWDAKEKMLIWRGSATAVVSNNPEKNAKKIDKSVKKIAKKWQKMKPGF